ncbi:2-oxo acid dehydrogenase subunit E2 [Salmonella enterica]|nr:2-oxo acid dehydrogenase subunit E2 [Salmonella enterica]EDL3488742.1 diaminohydroxyphosphoribosylaminopyrimidine deaminase [Salmonella enterica subsp. enterica serovar Newport]EDU0502801.1 2-oxo acid dehydrogenase subunit E2 [Salmonella enterica subsp. salamae]EDV1506933.1 2-oxo acid dehydrogenase subunit E2 [Salmonella enterica subsp. salamae]EEI9684186.1 2-oxo acid dehydrogenase subunit E2 [Salmonella enterica]
MANIYVIEVPKWGLTMEEGTLVKWLVSVDESFHKGQELCEIETSKIINVLEASRDGVMCRFIAKIGETLPVGAVLAVCADQPVSEEEVDTWIKEQNITSDLFCDTEIDINITQFGKDVELNSVQSADIHSSVTSDHSKSEYIPEILKGACNADINLATPHALKKAAQWGIDLRKVSPCGKRISVADLENAIRNEGGYVIPFGYPLTRKAFSGSCWDDTGVPATPVARRLAKKLGVNLLDCRRTAKSSRVCKADVEAVAYQLNIGQSTESSTIPLCTESSDHSYFTTEPLSAVRKTIASRLQISKQNAPHYRLTIELNMEALLNLKDKLNVTYPDINITVNDILVKSVSQALIKVPELNIQFDEKQQLIRRFVHADVAIAVALPAGLFTPVLRSADKKSITEIASELHQLFNRTRAGNLQPEEYQGGTFCISNLGMYGIQQFDAIINPPQCAILAVGTIEPRVVVNENNEAIIKEMMTVSLSCDHRVIDGATGAIFLQNLKKFVEMPELMLA